MWARMDAKDRRVCDWRLKKALVVDREGAVTVLPSAAGKPKEATLPSRITSVVVCFEYLVKWHPVVKRKKTRQQACPKCQSSLC